MYTFACKQPLLRSICTTAIINLVSMAHSTTSTACHTIQFVIKILPVNRIPTKGKKVMRKKMESLHSIAGCKMKMPSRRSLSVTFIKKVHTHKKTKQ